MKTQIITKQDIQCDLLAVLNKRKVVAIWLTVFLCVSTLLYILYAVLYANGVYLPPHRLSFVSPTAVMIIVPIVLLFLAIFLLNYYYSSLYKIKTENYEIIEDKLCQKEKNFVSYYHRTEKENLLYFRYGRIGVDEKVYSGSNIGDSFYLVILKFSKAPSAAYPMKYYEINDV